jgi:hypothetical protein
MKVSLHMGEGTRKQFAATLILLEQRGLIANFAFTKSTSLKEAKSILTDIGKQNTVKVMYTGK